MNMGRGDTRRWILVTGASRGIGRAIALKLARDSFGVILHCRSEVERLNELRDEILALDGEARTLAFDIADRALCRAQLEVDIAKNGCYYGVVCNAGLTRDAVFPGMADDDWDTVMRTNLDGFYNVLKPVLMPMIRGRKGGRIVVLSSVAGQIGNRGQVNYSASKAGLIGAAKSLALELASRDITVNCVAPGLIETEMSAAVPRDEMLKLIPAGRLGAADEVAGLVSYLCSDVAAYVTRQVIAINGGLN